jgi:hypothetical protein
MRTRPVFFSLLTLLALTNRSLAQNTAIVTDGATSYISFNSPVIPASGDFTIEFWAYIPSADNSGAIHEFVSQGQPGNGFYIGYQWLPYTESDGTVVNTAVINAGDSWPNTGVPLPIGSWTHIALTQTGGTANLYVNDSLWATNSGFSIGNSGSNFAIGVNYDGATGFIQGGVDEMRVWNVVRTAPQIKANWYTIDPATSGLIAYYNMNEGSGSVLDNYATATSGTLNGTLNNSPAWPSSPLQASANAINLTGNGTDTKVFVPNHSYFNDSTGTVELWVNPDPSLTGDADIFGLRGQDGAIFSFHVAVDNQRISFYNVSQFLSLSYPFAGGTWYHLAFAMDGVNDTIGVYVNGGYLGQFAAKVNTDPALLSDSLPIVMGVSESFPPAADIDQFTGSLDQVYYWNTIRTPTQIASDMVNPLTGNESGLLLDLTFDQGLPSGDNSFLTTVIDQTPNNNGAQLRNFAMTGSTGNFVPHAVTLPVNWLAFTVTGRNNEAILQWQTAQEENSKDFVIQRSPDGQHFNNIGSVPAAGNASTPRSYSFTDPAPVIGNNFYRLREEDQGSQYSYSDIRLLTLTGLPGALVWYITGDKTAEVDYKQGANQLYTVTDMTGRTIQQGQLSGGKLYLSGLASGIYAVAVFTSTGVLTTKIMIQ